MRRSIKICVLGLFLALFFYNHAAAEGESGNSAVKRLNESVISFFTPSTGKVTSADSSTVKVSIDNEVPFKKGARLSVYRQGEPFYHPVTGELIGSAEDLVGVVEVSDDNGGGLYTCIIIKGDIKSGDITRVTSSTVKLAFFQDREADWSLSDAFYTSLKDSGRFEIKEKYAPDTERGDLLEISKELGAEVMLFLSTPVVDNKKELSVELFWTEDSKQLSKLTAEISSEYVNELTQYEDFISRSFTDKEPWSTFELTGGELFAVGDINGNGAKELVVSDGTDITIYDMQKEMQEIWSISGSTRERHISLGLLDLNGNGRDEIFITSVVNEESTGGLIGESDLSSAKDNGRISSLVIEYASSREYKKISKGLPFFMRVTSGRLLMQRFSEREILSTPVFTGKWQDGRYMPDSRLELPEGVNIYGFAYVDWQRNGTVHVVSIDDRGFLNMYKKGELLWRSESSYGRPSISFKKGGFSLIKENRDWIVRGRLLAVNTEGGQQIIAVKRNQLLSKAPRLGSYSAEVYTLKWDGGVMNEELMLREVSGTVSDYWVEGKRLYLLARSGLFSIAKKAAKGELARPSILYYFNFEER